MMIFSKKVKMRSFVLALLSLSAFAAALPLSAASEPSAATALSSRGLLDLLTRGQVDIFDSYVVADKSLAARVRGTFYSEIPLPGALTRLPFRFLYDEALTDEEKRRIDERLAPFLATGHSGTSLELLVQETEELITLPATDRAGHFEADVLLRADSASAGEDLLLRTTAKLSKRKVFAGELTVVGKEGFSVISDIDDTIKLSEVLDTKKALAHTFIQPYEAISGMPELYRYWAEKLPQISSPVAWHYVSGSPGQLFSPLAQFLHGTGFPRGSMDLTKFALTEPSSIIDIINDVEGYKLERIRLIMKDFPERKYVLVGDSTQSDPEVYGTIAREFPENIACIFIRKVEGVNIKKEQSLNTVERFALAFRGLDYNRYWVFTDSSELLPLNVANGQCRPPLRVMQDMQL